MGKQGSFPDEIFSGIFPGRIVFRQGFVEQLAKLIPESIGTAAVIVLTPGIVRKRSKPRKLGSPQTHAGAGIERFRGLDV